MYNIKTAQINRSSLIHAEYKGLYIIINSQNHKKMEDKYKEFGIIGIKVFADDGINKKVYSNHNFNDSNQIDLSMLHTELTLIMRELERLIRIKRRKQEEMELLP